MDAVIHNAGIYTVTAARLDARRPRHTLAVNTLAPYILTALIERPASSGVFEQRPASRRGGIAPRYRLDAALWDTGKAYAESKLQVVALAFALARRWPGVLSTLLIQAGCVPGWAARRAGRS